MLSKFCKQSHVRQFLSNQIFIPLDKHLSVKLKRKYDESCHSSHFQSKCISANFSSTNPKSPKIRTYVDYEKDFVQLQPSKCYMCYVVASAIGIAIAYEFWSNVKDIKPFSYLQKITFQMGSESNEEKIVHNDNSSPKEKSYYLSRFESYATIEVDGKFYMTPRDFMDSVIYADQDNKGRVRRRKVTPEEVGYMLHIVPRIYDPNTVREALSSNPQLFRSLGAHGIISYSEYLFLLSLLTRSKRGLRHSFDVIDTSREGTVMRSEFNQFLRLATAKRFERSAKVSEENKISSSAPMNQSVVESTLLVHFFGRTNASGIYHDLNYEEFCAFIQGFQREILHAEFEEYSRGHDFIREEDFAEIFLKYTDLSVEECMKRMIWLSSLPENERIGIQFRDFELFCRLLKNLDDFSVAVKYISQVGRPLSRKEFKRAAKVCLNGKELSSHLVDTVFILFGASEGHDELSIDEFKNAMKHRLRRRVGIPINRKWSLESFKKCFRQNLRDERKMPKQPL